MNLAGPFISIVFIVIVAILLVKKYYPHAVLLCAGLLMLAASWLLDIPLPGLINSTGNSGLDLFRYITESFAETNMGVGLMIMAIGGFVAYIDKIGASDALVYLAMKPLSLLRRYPNMTAAAVIPIGQVLFVCIPSAAGLALLLMASVFPILVNLGVSRLSAVSVITATTAFGIGPASALTASAASIVGEPQISYFVIRQIPLVIPMTIVLTVSFYFVIRYFARKEKVPVVNENVVHERPSVPLGYAIIPVLPLIMLIVFSDIFQFFRVPIVLDTTTAMFISLFVAIICEFVRKREFRQVLSSLNVFWGGMGDIFKTVVTLIIAADIFAKGLIALGFIEGLVLSTQYIGFGAIGIGVIMVVMIFLASMLMGSGNAAFFAFGPLVPKIAGKFGIESALMILPMNLAASMGRTVSPVAGVIIAAAGLAGVTTFDIVKRNFIPLTVALMVMLIYHFI